MNRVGHAVRGDRRKTGKGMARMKNAAGREGERPCGAGALSVRDLADLFHCDPKTVRRLRSEGKLPTAVVVGSLVRRKPADIDAWLA